MFILFFKANQIFFQDTLENQELRSFVIFMLSFMIPEIKASAFLKF